MNKLPIPVIELLRLSFSGALVGVCVAGILWHGDETAQALLGIIGFGYVYLMFRNGK